MEQCLNTAQTPPGWGSAPGAAYRESTGTIPAGSGPPGAPETTGSAGGLLRGPAPQRQKEREAGTMTWAAGTFSAFWAGYSPPRLCLVPGLAAPGRQAGAVPVTMVSSALPPQGRHGRWMNERARQAVLGYAPQGLAHWAHRLRCRSPQRSCAHAVEGFQAPGGLCASTSGLSACLRGLKNSMPDTQTPTEKRW